jgi:hypothetical protein
MKKLINIFDKENITRFILVAILIAFASTQYPLINIIEGLLVVLGMTILISFIFKFFQTFDSYLIEKKWNFSVKYTIVHIIIIFSISTIFLIFLPLHVKNFVFLIIALITIIIFLYFLIKKLS